MPITELKYTRKEIQTITNNMKRYGGGFTKGIAMALENADMENSAKIIETWGAECEKYLNIPA